MSACKHGGKCIFQNLDIDIINGEYWHKNEWANRRVKILLVHVAQFSDPTVSHEDARIQNWIPTTRPKKIVSLHEFIKLVSPFNDATKPSYQKKKKINGKAVTSIPIRKQGRDSLTKVGKREERETARSPESDHVALSGSRLAACWPVLDKLNPFTWLRILFGVELWARVRPK